MDLGRRFLLVLLLQKTHANAQQRRNLVQAYGWKFEQLSEDKKLSKVCSEAGVKLVEQGQYFKTLDAEKGKEMQHWSREYTQPRNEKETHFRGWIRKNARFGLSWTKSLQSWWPIQYCSWGSMFIWRSNRILSGVDKFVRESMLTKEWEDTVSVKAIAKARPRRPRQKATVTLTSVSFLVHERRWIDIETQRWNDHKCFEVSKAVARLLRHDPTVPREPDGAIHFNDIIEECRKKFNNASQWPLENWISTLAKVGGAKKRFQCCWNPNYSNHFLFIAAIRGHSGESAIDLALQGNVLVPKGFTEFIHHVENASELNSIIGHGLIPGGKSLKRGRQVVFFTAVNPMNDDNCMEKPHATWRNQESLHTRLLGNAFI